MLPRFAVELSPCISTAPSCLGHSRSIPHLNLVLKLRCLPRSVGNEPLRLLGIRLYSHYAGAEDRSNQIQTMMIEMADKSQFSQSCYIVYEHSRQCPLARGLTTFHCSDIKRTRDAAKVSPLMKISLYYRPRPPNRLSELDPALVTYSLPFPLFIIYSLTLTVRSFDFRALGKNHTGSLTPDNTLCYRSVPWSW